MEKIRRLKDETINFFGGNTAQNRPTKATFSITVTTGSMKFAGTDSNVYVRLTGASGEESSLVRLDNPFRDDFERGGVDKFRVRIEDIGRPAILTIKHDDAGMFSDWFIVSVVVQKEGATTTHKFPVNMWVAGTVNVVEEAKHPKKEENPILISFHKREILSNKSYIKWRCDETFTAQGFPGCIMAPSSDDLPRNLQLDEEMKKDFEGRRKGGKHFVFEKIAGAFSAVDHISDIKNLFLNPKLPKIPDFQQNWERDEEFGRQILNGCNPTILKRCNRIPEKFPVHHEMVASQLTRGVRLEAEVKNGNIYIIDLDILDGVSCGKNPIDGSPYFSCAPLCLLYLNNKKQLVPVAIQLGQNPGRSNPIWTPDDTECDWLLAKIYFRNAEANVQLIVEKLFRTHFILEAFVVAGCRCLSSRHPVLKLMLPHLRYVCGGNLTIRNALLNQGGILDKLLSFGSGEYYRIMRSAFKSFDLKQLNIRALLRENGTIEADKLPGYHFRDDALILWDALEKFVKTILSNFYSNDQEVKQDEELHSFIQEIKAEGLACGDRKDRGIPERIISFHMLVELVTSVIFTSTCRNAAVSNALYDVLINVPNAPLCMLLPPPQDRKKATHETILRSLPSKEISLMQMSFCHSYRTARKKKVDRCCCMAVPDEKTPINNPTQANLEDYPNFLFSEDAVDNAMEDFKEELQQLGEVFQARNQGAHVPYTSLLPELIPFAISL